MTSRPQDAGAVARQIGLREVALEIAPPRSRVSALRVSHECLCKHPHVVLETLQHFSAISRYRSSRPSQSASLTCNGADILRAVLVATPVIKTSDF